MHQRDFALVTNDDIVGSVITEPLIAGRHLRSSQLRDAARPAAVPAVVVAAGDAGRDRGVDELARGREHG